MLLWEQDLVRERKPPKACRRGEALLPVCVFFLKRTSDAADMGGKNPVV